MPNIIISYFLKPEVSNEEYEKYFRQEKYSLVMSFPSVNTFKLNRVIQTLDGKKTADYVGVLEIESLESYQWDRETEEFQEFLNKWITFIEPSSVNVSYAEEVKI